MSAITLDTINAGRLRENGHMNYGKDGFGYPMQHTTIARLSRIDRYYKGKALEKAGKRAERLWLVEGAQVNDLDEAVCKLNVPPTLSEPERAFLDHVPADWAELHPFLRAMAQHVAEPNTPFELMWLLRSKGAVEVERREAAKASFIRRSPDWEYARAEIKAELIPDLEALAERGVRSTEATSAAGALA